MEFEVWRASKLFSNIHKNSLFAPKIIDDVPYYYVQTYNVDIQTRRSVMSEPMRCMQWALDYPRYGPPCQLEMYLFLPMDGEEFPEPLGTFTLFRAVTDTHGQLTLDELSRDEARVLYALIRE